VAGKDERWPDLPSPLRKGISTFSRNQPSLGDGALHEADIAVRGKRHIYRRRPGMAAAMVAVTGERAHIMAE